VPHPDIDLREEALGFKALLRGTGRWPLLLHHGAARQRLRRV